MKQKKVMEAKVVMIGDAGVGKSSLTLRFVHDKFDEGVETTLGAAYMEKVHTLEQRKSGEKEKQIKLKIWDTAGQEKYKALAKLYYKDCQAAFLIYDVTKKQSFANCKMWAQELIKHAPNNIVIGLVANKIDLLSSQQASPEQVTTSEEGRVLAKEIKASFFYEVSAKSKEGVDQMFDKIARQVTSEMLRSFASTQATHAQSSKLSRRTFIVEPEEREKRKNCCRG